MQIASKHIATVVAAACLFVALAFGGVAAWGEGSGENSITANVAESVNPAAVKVYQIASGAKDAKYDTYNYTFDIEAFAGLESSYDKENMNGSKWQEMADAAAAIVADAIAEGNDISEAGAGTTGTAITGLGDGLFLVIAETTYDPDYKTAYKFNPTIVALPTKAPKTNSDGEVIKDDYGYPIIETSADYGAWLTDAVITLKHETEPLYGSLVIEKKVDEFDANGESATFAFRVVSTADSPYEYDNYAGVTYDGASETASTTLTHIRAGTIVTVTEENAGPRYDGSGESKTVTIESDEAVQNGVTVVTVPFENARNTTTTGGHGIENHFEYQEDGDWSLEQR